VEGIGQVAAGGELACDKWLQLNPPESTEERVESTSTRSQRPRSVSGTYLPLLPRSREAAQEAVESFPGYRIDVRAICAAERVARVLERHPRLVLVIPHLGMDEYDDYARLTNGCDRLHLDTTMAIAHYFEQRPSSDVFPGCAARLHYGTDFPNLPFAWDRELKRILAEVPAGPIRDAILWDNAARLFGI